MGKEKKYTITVHKTSHFRKECEVTANSLQEAKKKGLELLSSTDEDKGWQWDGSMYQLNELGLCHKITEHKED